MTGSCIDLRKHHNDPAVMDVFGKLVSGRSGYVITEPPKKIFCSGCKLEVGQSDKFCSSCGTKVVLTA